MNTKLLSQTACRAQGCTNSHIRSLKCSSILKSVKEPKNTNVLNLVHPKGGNSAPHDLFSYYSVITASFYWFFGLEFGQLGSFYGNKSPDLWIELEDTVLRPYLRKKKNLFKAAGWGICEKVSINYSALYTVEVKKWKKKMEEQAWFRSLETIIWIFPSQNQKIK